MPEEATGRAALPWQAGLSCLFFIGYLWIFYRSIERQADYRKMAASYAHAMAIPCLLGILIALIYPGLARRIGRGLAEAEGIAMDEERPRSAV